MKDENDIINIAIAEALGYTNVRVGRDGYLEASSKEYANYSLPRWTDSADTALLLTEGYNLDIRVGGDVRVSLYANATVYKAKATTVACAICRAWLASKALGAR